MKPYTFCTEACGMPPCLKRPGCRRLHPQKQIFGGHTRRIPGNRTQGSRRSSIVGPLSRNYTSSGALNALQRWQVLAARRIGRNWRCRETSRPLHSLPPAAECDQCATRKIRSGCDQFDTNGNIPSLLQKTTDFTRLAVRKFTGAARPHTTPVFGIKNRHAGEKEEWNSKVKGDGLVQCSRTSIFITNRRKLEGQTCECYSLLKHSTLNGD